MQDDYYLPRYLDEPERMIIWTVPEFAFISIFCFMGLFIKQAIGLLVGICFALAALKIIKGFTHKHGRNYLRCLCYWYLPPLDKQTKLFPASAIRQWYL